MSVHNCKAVHPIVGILHINTYILYTEVGTKVLDQLQIKKKVSHLSAPRVKGLNLFSDGLVADLEFQLILVIALISPFLKKKERKVGYNSKYIAVSMCPFENVMCYSYILLHSPLYLSDILQAFHESAFY